MAFAADGLYIEPDTSPYTGTTLTTGDSDADTIVDTNLYESYFGEWSQDYSYGIDIGQVKTVGKLTVTCSVGGGGV